MNRFFLLMLLALLPSVSAFGSFCVVNESTKESVPDPVRDYKLWALTRICFDSLSEPTKISTQDYLYHLMLYPVTSTQSGSYGTGNRYLKIQAGDLEVLIIRSIDDTPLSLRAQTSDGFELVSSL